MTKTTIQPLRMRIRTIPSNEAALNIYLYGPSGSGKSTTGALLAQNLHLAWVDLDKEIETRTNTAIETLFATRGEPVFREIEHDILCQIISETSTAVIALGGGTLLDSENRRIVEKNGMILCLTADMETLLSRLLTDGNCRPLLGENPRQSLIELLARRQEHYALFGTVIDTTGCTPSEIAWEAQIHLGAFRISGMGQNYDVRIQPGSLNQLGKALQQGQLNGPIALVSDENVTPLYAAIAVDSIIKAGYKVEPISIRAGERHKTIYTVAQLWDRFVRAGIERSSTIVALGGGVTGDLTGFAAATYLRGIPWVNVPTSLLAMVDSSLGGKTGADLPQGKNLIGAFHSPRLVFSDPLLLKTLPIRELRNGLAEVLKHGIIADPQLYQTCTAGLPGSIGAITQLINRAAAVKAQVIEQDPFECGLRRCLNLGHTVGHGVELASGFKLSHGESISIGMAVEARLAEQTGVAHPGLANEISSALTKLGLPAKLPIEIDRHSVIKAMNLDKKRSYGQINFSLPEKIGKVRIGVTVDHWEDLIEL